MFHIPIGGKRLGGSALTRATVVLSSLAIAGSLTFGIANAQATRTWVSGVGDDANPCSRTAPCKTFAGAISKTAAGGEISVLDPGGYGAVTITKSMTLNGEGTLASILTSAGNAVIVNAGVNDVVVIHGLSLEGLGTSTNGVRFLAGKALFVEETMINGYGNGIEVNMGTAGSPSSATPRVFISDSQIRDNVNNGLLTTLTGTGSINVGIDNTTFENNAAGINARSNTKLTIRDSLVSGNSTHGLVVQPDTGTGQLTAESSVLNNNGIGLLSGGNGLAATARISNVTITGNTTGISIGANASVVSWGNNRINGNGTDGAPSQTIGQQ